jgi:elongation factor Ts
MSVNSELIKELRQRTGAGVLDVKKALDATGGDIDAAAAILRDKGLAVAAKKASREASQGHVIAYIHGDPGRIGALVEVNCETDFVARTEGFRKLAMDLAMQVAATSPTWVADGDIPPEVLEAHRQAIRDEMAHENKPPAILDRSVDGKIAKWLDEAVLLRQPFIRDGEVTIAQLVTSAIAEIGENIVVRRFARFELGAFDRREPV